MELKVNINYNQILKLIQQLPPDKLEKLTMTLQTELKVRKYRSVDTLKQLILNAPTWTDEQLNEYQKARDLINKSRLA